MSLRRDDRNALINLIQPSLDEKFDSGIILTYSADIAVVMQIIMALSQVDIDASSEDDQENDDTTERVSGFQDKLRAIGEVAPSLKVIVNRGGLKIFKRSKLIPLFDSIISEFSTTTYQKDLVRFHPKVMLLKYSVVQRGECTFRLIVSSRNLTVGQDFDTSIKVDLVLRKKATNFGKQLLSFFDEILRKEFRSNEVENLLKESLNLELDLKNFNPDQVSAARFLFQVPGSPLKDLFKYSTSECSERIIISPFLDIEQLRTITSNSGIKTYLISRKDTFDHLCATASGPELLKTLETYQCPPASLDSVPGAFGLHAKIFCEAMGDESRVLLGSSNFTSRGWNGQNVEANFELKLKRAFFEELKNEFISGEEPLAERRIPDRLELNESANLSVADKWRDALINIELETKIKVVDENKIVKLTLNLKINQLAPLPEGKLIYIKRSNSEDGPIAVQFDEGQMGSVEFKVPIGSFSGFVDLIGFGESGKDVIITRTFEVPTEISQPRNEEILFSIISDAEALFKFLGGFNRKKDIRSQSNGRRNYHRKNGGVSANFAIPFASWDGILKACVDDPKVIEQLDPFLSAKVESIKDARLREIIENMQPTWKSIKEALRKRL